MRPLALLAAALLTPGCVSLTAPERARTIGADNTELHAVVAAPLDISSGTVRLGVDRGLSDTVDVGFAWEFPVLIALRAQFQLLDSDRDPLDLSLHVGGATTLFASGQLRAGLSIGERLGPVELYLTVLHNTARVLEISIGGGGEIEPDCNPERDFVDDASQSTDSLFNETTHFLLSTLGARFPLFSTVKLGLHATAATLYRAPEYTAVLGALDLSVAF